MLQNPPQGGQLLWEGKGCICSLMDEYQGWMTGLLPLDIHCLSPAASMTLFTVHHFDEPTGATNASPPCKMNLLVKISALLINWEILPWEDAGFPKWNYIRK
jgi:hypothetical protein